MVGIDVGRTAMIAPVGSTSVTTQSERPWHEEVYVMADIVYGNRSNRVRELQRALVRLGHPVDVDGTYGGQTAGAVAAYLQRRATTKLPPWVVDGIIGDAPVEVTPGLRSIGAWVRRASLEKPDEIVAFARQTKIDRLDVVVNDHSACRSPTPFDTFALPKIERFCMRARDAGLSVHLMSWLMPHAAYIDQAAAVLVPLCQRVGAASLQWDAEEPWTKANAPLSYDVAAARIRSAFYGLGRPMGANAIASVSIAKFGPLAAICDYVVPQVYATASSGVSPEAGPPRYYRRYRDAFGKPVVMGLAAYKQAGIPGHTPASAIRAAIDATIALGDVDTAIYWSIEAIRSAPKVAAAIAAAPRRT